MTVTIDLDALQAAAGIQIPLLANQHVRSAIVTSEPVAGFDGISGCELVVNVPRLVGDPSLAPQVMVSVEQSTDGDSWSSAHDFAFTHSGVQSFTLDGPDNQLRVTCTPAGGLREAVASVTAVPKFVDVAGGVGGGSLPAEWTIGDDGTLNIKPSNTADPWFLQVQAPIGADDDGGGDLIQLLHEDGSIVFRVNEYASASLLGFLNLFSQFGDGATASIGAGTLQISDATGLLFQVLENNPAFIQGRLADQSVFEIRAFEDASTVEVIFKIQDKNGHNGIVVGPAGGMQVALSENLATDIAATLAAVRTISNPSVPLMKARGTLDTALVVDMDDETHISKIDMPNLPTSDPIIAGRLWNDSGTLKISAG